jgi:hypothetical protein
VDQPELPGPAATVKKLFGWKNRLAGACCYLPANVDSRVRPPLMKSLLHQMAAAWHSRPIVLKMLSS